MRAVIARRQYGVNFARERVVVDIKFVADLIENSENNLNDDTIPFIVFIVSPMKMVWKNK